MINGSPLISAKNNFYIGKYQLTKKEIVSSILGKYQLNRKEIMWYMWTCVSHVYEEAIVPGFFPQSLPSLCLKVVYN